MSCYAVRNPIYQPAMRLIDDVTQDYPAQVTTTFAHDYVDGMIVRLYIPNDVGMWQLNRQKSAITVTGDATFTIDIDTRTYDAFAIPSNPRRHQKVCPQVIPIGEVTSTFEAAMHNTRSR